MEELMNIIKELHPEVDFEQCITLVDDKILDSFDIVSIVAEIADRFHVIVSAEHIIPQNFNSVKALYALVQKLEEE